MAKAWSGVNDSDDEFISSENDVPQTRKRKIAKPFSPINGHCKENMSDGISINNDYETFITLPVVPEEIICSNTSMVD